jgi:hypothetical protein
MKSVRSRLSLRTGLFWATVCLVAVFGALFLSIHFFGQKPKPLTANSYTKGQPVKSAQSGQSTRGSNSQVPPSSDQKSPSSTPTTDLLAPSGVFVSDHHPNLGGTPTPNTESSTCNTTPGATCQILFTNGNITKSLQAEVTDVGGAVYWNWNLQDAGVTQGIWSVKAQAKFGDQTKTTVDPLNLDVQK